MKRVIYAPNMQELERAEVIARSLRLPIQIGDSPSTEEMKFDRREVQILQVPCIKEITCHDLVNSQITFYCDITDEWINFLENEISVSIENQSNKLKFLPALKEVNHARFCPRVNKPGLYTLSVIINNEVHFEKELRVV